MNKINRLFVCCIMYRNGLLTKDQLAQRNKQFGEFYVQHIFPHALLYSLQTLNIFDSLILSASKDVHYQDLFMLNEVLSEGMNDDEVRSIGGAEIGSHDDSKSKDPKTPGLTDDVAASNMIYNKKLWI